MAASGGLPARKTQPDDQPTKISTEKDDTHTAGGQEGAQLARLVATAAAAADCLSIHNSDYLLGGRELWAASPLCQPAIKLSIDLFGEFF